MNQHDLAGRQRRIAAKMHISNEFIAEHEIERRTGFLAEYLRASGLKTYVLGISGGVDSTTAGRLAQLAVERLRAQGYEARFVAVRQRMIAQYAVAGARAGVVIGTDHAAGSVMGFFTKFGDGGADVPPLAGLNKRRVRAVARALGAPDTLAHKVPTIDLEMLRPQRPDENAYGIAL